MTNFTFKKLSYKDLLIIFIFSLIILLFYISLITKIEINNESLLVVFVMGIIAAIAFTMMIIDLAKNAFSLNMMHWFFCFIFFGVAALIQYTNNNFLYDFNLSHSDLLKVCLIVLLWMVSYIFGQQIRFTKSNKKNFISKILRTEIKPSYIFVLFSTFISFLITIYIISQSGFSSIFSRSTASSVFEQNTLAQQQLMSTILRNFVLYSLAFTIIFFKKNKEIWPLLLFHFILFFVVNSPFGLARFNIAIAYIGTILLLFPLFRKKKLFIFIFFFAFIIVFPMINVFRRLSLNEVNLKIITSTINDISSNFLRGDFDAFSMLIYTYKYISDFDITYGYQLLGPLTFFIPRTIWPDKPIGSGAMILESYGHAFTNGSEPLVAEGLINFGIVGVIVFGISVGKLVKFVDTIYWNQSISNNATYIYIFYPFTLSMFFFIQRGDLFNTFAFSTSHVFVFTLLFFSNNLVFGRIKSIKK